MKNLYGYDNEGKYGDKEDKFIIWFALADENPHNNIILYELHNEPTCFKRFDTAWRR